MTDQALPAPPVPATIDLRSFEYMPLYVARLRDSETASKTDGEEFRAAVMLWCAAWHQVPASSLPDDDIELAKLAGFGRAVKEWKKVRTGALRGFVRCSDGRLYHSVIAQQAVASWISKLEQKHRSECARIKKWNQRHPDDQVPVPTFALWITCEYPESAGLLSPGQDGHVLNTGGDCPEDNPPMSPEKHDPREVKGSSSINHHRVFEASGPGQPSAGSADGRKSKPSPKPGSTGWQAWVEREGKRLGLKPGGVESWDEYGARVRAAVDRERAGHGA